MIAVSHDDSAVADQSMTDVEQICDLKYRYCWCYDAGDLDELLTLFTEDAICDFGEFGSWIGITDIRNGYIEQMKLLQVPGSRAHFVANPLIDVDGDRAVGRWYVTSLRIDPASGNSVGTVAKYHDAYRRQGPNWLIARTSLNAAWLSSNG